MPYARNDDVELYYETFGSSTDSPLLLVNGLGSQCINFRTEFCERFVDEGFFVIRYDNRDVGLSTKFSHVEPDVIAVLRAVSAGREPEVPYTLDDMADDGFAVLDDLGIERAHVMGLSMGGMIVQTMAIRRPDRLLSMVSVMSTTGDPDVGQPSREARELLMAPPETGEEGYLQRALRAAQTWGSLDCYDEERITAWNREAFERSFDPAGQARQLMAINASPSRSTALAEVHVPTLVLHGSEDKLIDPSGGRRTAEVIPRARMEVLEGMGHDYPPEHWERWVALVAEHARSAQH